jgi:hypothetical protein
VCRRRAGRLVLKLALAVVKSRPLYRAVPPRRGVDLAQRFAVGAWFASRITSAARFKEPQPASASALSSDTNTGVLSFGPAREDCAMPEGSTHITRLDKVSSILGPPLRGTRSAAGESCSTRLR